MELVSPAGNLQKLRYAYEYGADSVYIGLKNFSLRVKADNFHDTEYEEIAGLKERFPGKKLFCALNIAFHNSDIDQFLGELSYFSKYPFDAFIIQDVGMVRILEKHFPRCALHLSTQANCINREAVRFYRDMGFKRIVLGREASLEEIGQIKDAVPEMELEAFCHGAMCIAYSGRCLMSSYMTGRSANSGNCTHSCRWEYQVLQEKERPGEYFPVFQGEGFTSVLSSRDLCMIEHLGKMRDAGIGALKIEGRMKSLYYTALVTRAYRKAIDALEGKLPAEEAEPFINELYNTSHREFGTGFYFGRADADKTTHGAAAGRYEMAGIIGAELSGLPPGGDCSEKRYFEYISTNKTDSGAELEYIGPHIISLADRSYRFLTPDTHEPMSWVSHGHPCVLCTDKPVEPGYMVRVRRLDAGRSAD